jgi:hypothetical protein
LTPIDSVIFQQRLLTPAERRDLSTSIRDEFGVQAGGGGRINRCTTDECQGTGLLLLGG